MALVMLPCDLPWWGSVQNQLKKIATTKNTIELIEGMQKLHDMCNISLDPDEDIPDPQQFVGLLNFLDNELTSAERSNFLCQTLPSIANRAASLKLYRPKNGLHFSLQQQSDLNELEYNLVASLIANAFFSTFPKRTDKTHPTLQNFNFSWFFKHLTTNVQKAKLRSLLHFFDWLDKGGNAQGSIKIMRQVMSSKEWLTIEDWLECTLPLCSLQIRHEGKLDRSQKDCLNICFATNKIGGNILDSGCTQECINFTTSPELLCTLLHVEALEDNEVITIERVRRVSRILDAKNKATLELLTDPDEITICCIDAEDYSKFPLSQYVEDNILRELNKCLLGYQQKQTIKNNNEFNTQPPRSSRRLSPIGESTGSNSESGLHIPIITQDSCSTNRSGSESPKQRDYKPNMNNLRVETQYQHIPHKTTNEAILNNRRGRFIVLGSSGECLPVKRMPVIEYPESLYSSCESSDDEYHSAKTSIDDDSDEENYNKRYSLDLETPERRYTFAERLRDALRRDASSISTSTESNYAVGISVAGSGLSDRDIKVRRRGSTGFMLQDDSLDDKFPKDSLNQEREWIDKFRNKQSALSRKESNKSSEYSFSTDYSSELEEVYEQFSRWLENPILETGRGAAKRDLDARELAVVQFAGSILKRTLSESFAGVPLTDGCENIQGTNVVDYSKKHKVVLNAKSLSLELARHKHRLAAQLSQSAVAAVPILEENENVDNVSDAASPVVESSSSTLANKKKLNWFATCVTSVVQTLEDICVKATLPQTQPVFTNEKLSQIAQKPKDGLKPIATGNWGCGSSKKGEVQLKVLIQWLAASVSGAPALIYYTNGSKELASLDTLYRILRDRKWTVKELTEATLRYSNQIIEGSSEITLFEELIGVAKNV